MIIKQYETNMIWASVLGLVANSAHDTDYVLLQASPLFRWTPINDEPVSSDDSSPDSTVFLQRTNSQRSIASQHSTKSACSHKPSKKTSSSITITRPSSLFISPPPSPKPAFRSKSTDERYMGNNIPLKTTSSIPTKKRRSISTLNDEIVITVSTSSMEKLSKLKDRLISTAPTESSPIPGVESDDESTPLVSELSTPTHSQSDSVFRHSVENSSSPSSNRSLPRDREHCIDVDYSDTASLVIQESSNDPQSPPRQDINVKWDNPETPVWHSSEFRTCSNAQ